jgi:hypothetical protein
VGCGANKKQYDRAFHVAKAIAAKRLAPDLLKDCASIFFDVRAAKEFRVSLVSWNHIRRLSLLARLRWLRLKVIIGW